jgi:hypothetical protein
MLLAIKLVELVKIYGVKMLMTNNKRIKNMELVKIYGATNVDD